MTVNVPFARGRKRLTVTSREQVTRRSSTITRSGARWASGPTTRPVIVTLPPPERRDVTSMRRASFSLSERSPPTRAS